MMSQILPNDVRCGTDIEPSIAASLDRKAEKWSADPYIVKSDKRVKEELDAFIIHHDIAGHAVDLKRLGGGGSKEQFSFYLDAGGDLPRDRFVLRVDPKQSAIETDRRREFDILRAMGGVIPVPSARWLDADGKFFGTPALITSFVDGVTKPVDKPAGNISGLGTAFGYGLRETLANQFIDHLVAVHKFDWRASDLPSYSAPTADRLQAARWQLNWWSRVWNDDKVEAIPTMAVAEQWLRSNLPPCADPVVVHGDFRSGNFLFDSSTKQITAVLDWELAHIGDYHQDLAYILMEPLGTRENGVSYATGLFEREWFLEQYAARSGLSIEPEKLLYYEILNCYMSIVIALATCVRSARDSQTHQDTHGTWIAALGHNLHSELCRLLERGGALR